MELVDRPNCFARKSLRILTRAGKLTGEMCACENVSGLVRRDDTMSAERRLFRDVALESLALKAAAKLTIPIE